MPKNCSISESSLRQLSLLVSAGIPLSKALDSLVVFSDVAEKVKAGASFADSLGNAFPLSVRKMIAVGERSGDLAGSIKRACFHMENNTRFRNKVISALIYPCFVMLLCFAALFILMAVLLPSFSNIFDSLGVKLPLLSRMILGVGRYFPIIIVLLISLSVLFIRRVISDAGLNIPLIGPFRRRVLNSAFFHSMSQYLSAGLSMVDSMDMSIGSLNSPYYAAKLETARSSVINGHSLSDSLSDSGLFISEDISLISAGESSSSLALVFSSLSAYHEDGIENTLKTIAGLAEPISTLATGLVVGIIVFAMFMPIIKLISVLGS